MRNRFEQQTQLGIKLIEDTPVLQKSRDDVPALLKALLEIYKTLGVQRADFCYSGGYSCQRKEKDRS